MIFSFYIVLSLITGQAVESPDISMTGVTPLPRSSDRKKVEKKIKETSLASIPEVFEELDQPTIVALTDILTGKIIGHQIFHVWYDMDSQQQTLYNGKVEKLLKKAGGTYRVGYWLDGEDYETDAVQDLDVSKYALAADLVCGDLTLS